jgi:hypothetical protein
VSCEQSFYTTSSALLRFLTFIATPKRERTYVVVCISHFVRFPATLQASVTMAAFCPRAPAGRGRPEIPRPGGILEEAGAAALTIDGLRERLQDE